MGEQDDSVATAAPREMTGSPEIARYDDVSAANLERRLHIPRAAVYAETGSTMDIAHVLAAAGAPAGTVVLADRQTAGRGRSGRTWLSAAGAGIWLTLIERPDDGRAIEVLALRVGLRTAGILDRYAGRPVGLKWPNDLYLDGRKLAGVLIEARWQDGAPTWVAIGLGVNLHAPVSMTGAAAGLPAGTRRLDVLADLVPQLRAAAAARDSLTPAELAQFAERDIARGRFCRSPGTGRVEGVAATGAIVISHEGVAREYRSGSLVLTEELEGQ
jgi:BirA family biotin operon repressor/biotin-[acetyl-CoA-carboxylase] ligase